MRNKIWMMSVISLIAGVAHADSGIKEVQGAATLTYKGHKITTEEKQKAFVEAEENAIERYYANLGQSYYANYEKAKPTIVGKINKYILGTSIISQQDHKSLRMYQISLQVQLNGSLLKNAVMATTAAGSTPDYKKTKIGFFFVARSVQSAQDFDDRVYSRVDNGSDVNVHAGRSNAGIESQNLQGSSIGVGSRDSRSASINVRTEQTRESGGSVLRQATKYKYTILTSENLNTVFAAAFAKSGFEGIPAAFIAPSAGGLINISVLDHEYESGRNIKPETLNNLARGMQLVQIPYLAVGSLDVGLPTVDPSTGLKMVIVTVNDTIYDVESQFPTVIGAVGPKQYQGLGPTQQSAEVNAIKAAAKSAATTLISRLNEQSVN